MKLWLALVRNTLMGSLTYRAHSLFQVVGSVVAILILWFLWRAVFDAAGTTTVRGMSFGQTFLYVALSAALFVLMRSWVEWDIHWQVRSGDIIVHFFRPYDFMTAVFAGSVGSVAANLLAITVPSLVVVFLVFGAPVPSPVHLLLFVPALLLAYLVSFLIDFTTGVAAFHTESIWGISATKDTLVLFLSGGMIPLAYFPDAVRDVLLWLPFAGLYNTPIALLAGGISDDAVAGRLGLQAFWAVVFFALARWALAASRRRLAVAGG